MPNVLNFPCCKLLCIKLTALLTPRWMSWRVVAGKPCRSLLYSTSLAGEETSGAHASVSHAAAFVAVGANEPTGTSRRGPEVGLQRGVGVIDHGTQTVDVGAGQRSADALLHNIETVIHHAGGQLTFLVGIHGNSLRQKTRLNMISYTSIVKILTKSKIIKTFYTRMLGNRCFV